MGHLMPCSGWLSDRYSTDGFPIKAYKAPAATEHAITAHNPDAPHKLTAANGRLKPARTNR